MLVAGAPDLDIFFPLAKKFLPRMSVMPYWLEHRGITHSLLMVPVWALLMAWVWHWLRRRSARRAASAAGASPPAPAASFGWLYACGFTAVLTHPLLDYCTSFGTQLFCPITTRRYALNVIGIMDVIFTSILLLSFAAGLLLRRRGRAPAVVGAAALVLCLAYLAAGQVFHDRAVAAARADVNDGHAVLRAEAFPAIGTIFLWRAVAETESRWHVYRIHALKPAGHRILRSDSVVREADNPWARRALASPEGRRFAWFADGLARTEVSPEDHERLVTLHDMRYGIPLESADSIFQLQLILNGDGSVRRTHERHDAPADRRQRMLRDIWNDIWNP